MKIVRLKTANASVLADIHQLLKQLSSDGNFITLAALKKILAKPDTEIWVARDNACIAGMATLMIMRKLRGVSAYVEDVVVDEEYRGRGLGKALIGKLIERARAHRAHDMEFTSKPSRVAANALYQKLGFKIRETNVYRMKF